MARRSPYLGDYGLPVGGRSSGSRPKKKVKAKLRKSKARRSAEYEVEFAEKSRKAAKRAKVKSPMGKTVLARTAKKQAGMARQQSRKAGSASRKATNPETKRMLRSAELQAKETADKMTPAKVARRRRISASYEKGADASASIRMSAGKRLVKARKKLANTPRYGGKMRISSGNRNRFLQEPKLSDH